MPVVDFALSALSFVTAIRALNSPNSAFGGGTNSGLVIAGGALVGGLAFTSGAVGLARTSDCDKAKAEDVHARTVHLEHAPADATAPASQP